MEVGDLVQSFTMDGGVRVRSFWIQTDIEIPTTEGPAQGDVFAAFTLLPANRDDEWGLFMVGASFGPSFDRRLDTHHEGVKAMWAKLVVGDEAAEDEVPFQLRRNIAFGTTIGEIAKDPISHAARHDLAFTSLTKMQRDILSNMPVESVRHMRDAFRTGRRG